MRSGAMRYEAVIERPVAVQTGRTTELDWRAVGTTRAAVRPMTGRELWYAGQNKSEANLVVTVRGHDAICPRDRIRIPVTGRVFEVVYPRPDERGRWIEADCKEAPANG